MALKKITSIPHVISIVGKCHPDRHANVIPTSVEGSLDEGADPGRSLGCARDDNIGQSKCSYSINSVWLEYYPKNIGQGRKKIPSSS